MKDSTRFKKAKLLNAFERLQARWRYLNTGVKFCDRSSMSIYFVLAFLRIANLHDHKTWSFRKIRNIRAFEYGEYDTSFFFQFHANSFEY